MIDIQGLSKKTIGDSGRKIDPTDICRKTLPEIMSQEWLFFNPHCALFFNFHQRRPIIYFL